VRIDLIPLLGVARRCSGCGRMVTKVHDVTFRWVRDLTILDAETWLWLGRVRGPVACGPKLEALDLAGPL